ncbi:hypothetical protein ABLE68_06520 [Nocardioides sp. CN2-186]|uniref:hypothetical protein n=1 Tax=Nocardioides tweenelious TaxID=3156607 RepID=UPI0032B3FF55
MVDGDQESTGPSLELPKLGWRRKQKATAPEPAPAPTPEPLPEAPVAEETPAPPPAPAPPAPAPELAETRPLYVDEAETAVATEPAPPPAPAPVPVVDSPPRSIKLRRPGGMLAVVVTGIVVGLGMVGLTWASLQACSAIQGTSSCGRTGYPMLIVILVLAVVLGGLLLRVARVPEPGSTSFLAVGLASVIALLFFVNSLTDPAMVAVIPIVCAATYALAHWVTRTFIEPASR